MSEMTDDFFEHFGVKGMKWGVRRDSIRKGRRSGKNNEPVSEDKKQATNYRKRSVDSLSNSELRRLNERLQLERQYSQLTKTPNIAQRGLTFIENAAFVVRKANDIYNLINSPVVALGRKAVTRALS